MLYHEKRAVFIREDLTRCFLTTRVTEEIGEFLRDGLPVAVFCLRNGEAQVILPPDVERCVRMLAREKRGLTKRPVPRREAWDRRYVDGLSVLLHAPAKPGQEMILAADAGRVALYLEGELRDEVYLTEPLFRAGDMLLPPVPTRLEAGFSYISGAETELRQDLTLAAPLRGEQQGILGCMPLVTQGALHLYLPYDRHDGLRGTLPCLAHLTAPFTQPGLPCSYTGRDKAFAPAPENLSCAWYGGAVVEGPGGRYAFCTVRQEGAAPQIGCLASATGETFRETALRLRPGPPFAAGTFSPVPLAGTEPAREISQDPYMPWEMGECTVLREGDTWHLFVGARLHPDGSEADVLAADLAAAQAMAAGETGNGAQRGGKAKQPDCPPRPRLDARVGRAAVAHLVSGDLYHWQTLPEPALLLGMICPKTVSCFPFGEGYMMVVPGMTYTARTLTGPWKKHLRLPGQLAAPRGVVTPAGTLLFSLVEGRVVVCRLEETTFTRLF